MARRPGRRTRPKSPPSPFPPTPKQARLRRLLREHPGYRRLVQCLDRFRLQALLRFRGLPKPARDAIGQAVQETGRRDPRLATASMRNQVDTIRRRVPLDAMRNEKARVWAARPRTEPTPSLFFLLVAWEIMQRDNTQAGHTATVRALVQDIARRRRLSVGEVFQWSYVPRPVIELLPIRLSEDRDRQVDARSVRRLRQLQRGNRPIPPELTALGLEPIDAASTGALVERPGLGQAFSEVNPASDMGGTLFRPLLTLLLRHADRELRPHADSWQRVCIDASGLIHARYPDLWKDNPELVRRRFPPDYPAN